MRAFENIASFYKSNKSFFQGTIFSNLFIGLISIFLSLIISFAFYNNSILATFFTFVITTIFLNSVLHALSQSRIEDKIDDVHKRLDDENIATSISDMNALIKDITREVKGAKEVKNTAVQIPNNYNNTRSEKDPFKEVFFAWYNSGGAGRWHDIIGLKERHSDRYKNFQFTPSKEKDFFISVMRPYSTMTNFIVIKKESSSVVYFGFGKSDEENPRVFKSHNTDMVAYFNSKFDSLQKYTWHALTEPTKVEISNNSQPVFVDDKFVDKEGKWITVSTVRVQNVSYINSVGLLEVRFFEDTSCITVRVFNENGVRVENSTHTTAGQPMFDDGGFELPGKNTILIRDMDKDNLYVFYEFGANTLDGHYINDKTNDVNSIFGRRVTHPNEEALFKEISESQNITAEHIDELIKSIEEATNQSFSRRPARNEV